MRKNKTRSNPTGTNNVPIGNYYADHPAGFNGTQNGNNRTPGYGGTTNGGYYTQNSNYTGASDNRPGNINGYGYYPTYSEPQQHNKRYTIEQSDMLFTLVITLLSVFISIFGYPFNSNFSVFFSSENAALGFTIIYDLIFIAVSIYLYSEKSVKGIFPVLCGLTTLALSSVFSLSSNDAVNAAALFCMYCTSSVWFYSLAGRKDANGEMSIISAILNNSIGIILRNFFAVPAALFGRGTRKKNNFGKILGGVLAAVPVTAFAAVMLSRADVAFDNVFSNTFITVTQTAWYIFRGLLLVPFILAYAIGLKKENQTLRKPFVFRTIDTTFVTSFLSVLSVCYLIYLFSQLSYLFTAFGGMLPANYQFSYAEYARRGFIELCIIATLNIIIVYATVLLTDNKIGVPPLLPRALAAFITMFTLVIITTAFAKMYIYIGAYGLTLKRVYATAFMLFLAVLFVFLLFRMITPKVKVFKAALVTASVIIAVLGITNINAIIAEHNYNFINTPGQTLYVSDLRIFASLGDEGIGSLVNIANDKEKGMFSDEAEKLVYEIAKTNYYELVYDDATGNCIGYEKVKVPVISMTSSRKKAYRYLDGFLDSRPDSAQRLEHAAIYSPAG